MLEVGAGTGRFATFLRDNYPYATLTVSDLSPFYLEKARNNMRYWQEKNSSTSRMGVLCFSVLDSSENHTHTSHKLQGYTHTSELTLQLIVLHAGVHSLP
jgi:tRNA A58 N-methylase Trm61